MRLIQFQISENGRRVGVVEGKTVYDLTAGRPGWDRVYNVFREARGVGRTIAEHISASAFRRSAPQLRYPDLWRGRPGDRGGWLLPPIDHPDPAHCLIAGTGLTHLGSISKRDQMHQREQALRTDSQKMFDLGLAGGKPRPGCRGVVPEGFYKGNATILRGHNDCLDIPPFAKDGGEEPEIVGCYVIGNDRTPYRLGFAIANEWSDHDMERINYLYLIPSKLRDCSVGPELVTDELFQDLHGFCRIHRNGEVIYDSGELLTGEQHMTHSLANLEDHHFKHPQFRVPGDVHIYFFGTMKFSFGERGSLQDGDRIEIHFEEMHSPLVNYVRRIPPDSTPIVVRKG